MNIVESGRMFKAKILGSAKGPGDGVHLVFQEQTGGWDVVERVGEELKIMTVLTVLIG